MKEIIKKSILINVLSGLFVVSCGPKPEEQVKEFAVKFGDSVNTSQKDSIQKYYPDFQLTDSLNNVPLGDITVEPGENPEDFLVKYSPETYMIIKNDKGQIQVLESKGLLAFPADKVDIAKKTGMWDDSILDVELAIRMDDEDFFDFISKKTNFNPDKILIVGKKFIETGEEDNGRRWDRHGYYTITNNTSQTIKSTDYNMNFRDDTYAGDELDESKKYSEPGKEIAPNGTIRIESNKFMVATWNGDEHHLVGVTILLTPEEIQERFVSFSGNEYQEYLDSKK